MKKVLFMLLAFVTINLNANKLSEIVDSTISTTKTVATSTLTGIKDATNFVDTSGLYRTMYTDLKSGVVAIAQTLKTTTQMVLLIIGKKYFLQGIYAWVLVLFFILTLVLIWYFNYRYVKTNKEKEPIYAFLLMSTIICIVGVFVNLQDAINYTFNPEYYVLQEIINTVKSFK